MSTLKAWVGAARLRTLPLAISSIGMGGFLAVFYHSFQPDIFIFCLLTTLLLQILSNFANDYGDSIHGADSKDRQGPLRAVQAGHISQQQMKKAMFLFSLLTLFSGLILLFLAFKKPDHTFLIFLALGLAAISAAIKYTTGKNPYGYSGLGDFFVFLFFGLTGVLGTFFLQSGSFSWSLVLPAISVGLFSTGVLNINNIRDIESDRKAGKHSIPVRIGVKKAKIYHVLLLLTGFGAATLFSLMEFRNIQQFLFLITLPLFLVNGIKVFKLPQTALDPYLRQMAVSTLVFVLLFGIGIITGRT